MLAAHEKQPVLRVYRENRELRGRQAEAHEATPPTVSGSASSLTNQTKSSNEEEPHFQIRHL
jgi:hypothetical protein